MLTKKQLQDLAINYGIEVTVGDIPAVAAARAALAYREMLERLEWVYDQQRNRMVCPACGAIKAWQPTHIKNCELAALLEAEKALEGSEC